MSLTKIETGVGPVTDKFVNTIVDTINSESFRKNVASKVLDPITVAINEKVKPYLYLIGLLYLIVVVLLIIIIVLLVKRKK